MQPHKQKEKGTAVQMTVIGVGRRRGEENSSSIARMARQKADLAPGHGLAAAVAFQNQPAVRREADRAGKKGLVSPHGGDGLPQRDAGGGVFLQRKRGIGGQPFGQPQQ